MTNYEKLVQEVEDDGIQVVEFDFSSDDLHGLYADGCVAINKRLTSTEKALTLYEEWGHARTSSGDILDQSSLNNRKQEQSARRWAFERFMPLDKFIATIKEHRPTDTWELLDALDVPLDYLTDLIGYYRKKYGLKKNFDGGTIYFDPVKIVFYH